MLVHFSVNPLAKYILIQGLIIFFIPLAASMVDSKPPGINEPTHPMTWGCKTLPKTHITLSTYGFKPKIFPCVISINVVKNWSRWEQWNLKQLDLPRLMLNAINVPLLDNVLHCPHFLHCLLVRVCCPLVKPILNCSMVSI